jgi:hypothetical protein
MCGCGWIVHSRLCADYGRSIDSAEPASGSLCVRFRELMKRRALLSLLLDALVVLQCPACLFLLTLTFKHGFLL